MTNGQRVLVVDGLSETEQVLKAVLEPQGLKVNRIRTHFAENASAGELPHLVILHEDSREKPSTDADFWPDVPRVIIGSLTERRDESQPWISLDSRERHLSQPFQYRDLLLAVENLLADTP